LFGHFLGVAAHEKLQFVYREGTSHYIFSAAATAAAKMPGMLLQSAALMMDGPYVAGSVIAAQDVLCI
jgi:hypothetical protein